MILMPKLEMGNLRGFTEMDLDLNMFGQNKNISGTRVGVESSEIDSHRGMGLG